MLQEPLDVRDRAIAKHILKVVVHLIPNPWVAKRQKRSRDRHQRPYTVARTREEYVAFACSTSEVSEIVKICARHKVPVVPFGGGTSLEGHVAALHGGLCIDTSQMNRILQFNPDDFDVTVEAGVTLE